ncbi:GNAT family N-acetyltransferase [Candidatus Sororendozoicomonas aggregata]|uniref:GNAT family N-acetyltransferase n=1 Tax=Candidatus Sororendozoicomonas aggregata TaxID=3073239 RepID=UPI002ECFC23C
MRIVAETPHLIIRTWQESDLPDYAELLGDSIESTRYSEQGPDSRAETDLWRYQLEQDAHGWSRWAVVYKETNEFIGYCGFAPYHHDVEISWRFLPDFRGKGLVIEAIEALAKVGFETLGFDKIISFTSPDNLVTQGIMKQVGMTLDRIEGWSSFTIARYSLSKDSSPGTLR